MTEKNKENYPIHVAVIPDGNRRWAKGKKLPSWLGHRFGMKSLEKILETVRDLGIPYFTVWGGSYDNLTKRPVKEVAFLKELYRVNFQRMLKNKDIYNLKVKVNVFGFWEKLFSPRIKKPISEIIEKTKKYDQRFLNFLIGYNGFDEMIEAIKKIVKQARKDEFLEVTGSLIKSCLWTNDLPPVDLVIRTGTESDPHWSNGFMMWDVADAQLYFTETLWPDFSQKEFKEAIEGYSKRERRLGS